MVESLLDGEADYSDVMDALKKLEEVVKELVQVYPADRGSHAHAAYRAEILHMIDRINSWVAQQAKFMSARSKNAYSSKAQPVKV